MTQAAENISRSAPKNAREVQPGEALISARDLGKTFAAGSGLFAKKPVRAVAEVSFDLAPGKTLGLVGESGCGKSTVGRMAVGLMPPTTGNVFVAGRPLYGQKGAGLVPLDRPDLTGAMQMIFQDPFSSLNPRMRVGESVAEPLLCKPGGPGKLERERLVGEIFEMVGLAPDHMGRYPHEFSGGQRQRVAIARALVTSPAFVVCDEPTSSLDASVQAQVLNLLKDLQRRLKPAYLFISHDLAVVRHMSDETLVMYAGLIMEQAPSEELFASPLHPYTKLLLASVPGAPGGGGEAADASPQTALLTSGLRSCPFAERCPLAQPVCREEQPELRPLGEKAGVGPEGRGRFIRCHMV